MLSYLLILSVINMVFAFEVIPSCASCKWFIPNNKGNPDLGLCKMFRYTYLHNGKEIIQHDFSTHCRSSENLCGKSGFLYEAISEPEPKLETELETDFLNDYDELSNRCCGEVNETDEIEQLEKDFFEIFQRIKKHNKKRIYTASKDLYKLFKKN
jgi:hypothetical protein